MAVEARATGMSEGVWPAKDRTENDDEVHVQDGGVEGEDVGGQDEGEDNTEDAQDSAAATSSEERFTIQTSTPCSTAAPKHSPTRHVNPLPVGHPMPTTLRTVRV